MKKQALRELTTIGDVLDTVAAFDRAAHSFYADLAPRVSKSIRYLVEELAEAELAHIAMIEALRHHPDVETHLRDAIERPNADHRFSDAVHTPEMSAEPDPEQAARRLRDEIDALVR